MVETPLRRSRRVRSQADSGDEGSVGSTTRSRRARTSNASDASPVSTPTRRSTRVARTPRTAKTTAAQKEMETIPESINTGGDGGVDSAVVATPAKSSSKKKKKSSSVSASKAKKEIQGNEKDLGVIPETEPAGDAVVDAATTVASVQSSKQKKTAAKDDALVSEKGKSELMEEPPFVSEDVASPMAPTPAKSSKKKRKVKSELKEEPPMVSQYVASPTAPTPAQSAKKKRKDKSEPTEELPMVSQDVASPMAPTPAKSSKKKRKGKSELTEEPPMVSQDVASPMAPTPAKSSKKKRGEKSTNPDSADASSAKESPPLPLKKTNESASPLKDNSTVATSPKSTKKEEKAANDDDKVKVQIIVEGSEEATKASTDSASLAAPPSTKSPQKNSSKTPIEVEVPASTKKSKKKKKRKKTPMYAEGGKPMGKNARKKLLLRSAPGEASGDTVNEVSPSVLASAQKSKNKNLDKKTADSDAVDLSKPTAPPADTSEVMAKQPPKPSKKQAKKTRKGEKTQTKKKLAPHKKKQSHKHGRLAVGPGSKKGRSKVPPEVSSEALSRPPSEVPKLVMDVQVHRLRFLKLHPKAILAMASTPAYVSSGNSDHRSPALARLAISRQGGSVELLSPQDRWVSAGHIPGVRGREVDALVWVSGMRGKEDMNGEDEVVHSSSLGSQLSPATRLVDDQRRLFGCSRDGTIFELDFAKKRQKGVIGSGGGAVFCLASMSSRGNHSSGSNMGSGGYFAAGCEDGTVKIYSAFGSDGRETTSGMPELVATLPGAGDAILSLAWVSGQSASDDGGMGGSVIFAGVADGTIRRFDCTTAVTTGPISTGTVLAPSRGSACISYRWKSTLRMTVENRGLRESTKVWVLEALSDGTVISGDSLGHVQIWDGQSGTMTQTFDHNESGADVLCLAVSEDENKIFASGVDSSVRCIQRQRLPSTDAMGATPRNAMFDSTPFRNWISSTSHRKHSHDVRALAICHKDTSKSSEPLELLVSGSDDTRICTYIAKDFKSSRPRIWYNWPTLSPISASRKQRLLAVTRDTGIDLFRLTSPATVHPLKNLNPETRDENKCLVKTISIQSPFNLTCSVISDDGKFLAASDAVSLYVFSLEVEDEDGVIDVHPKQLDLPWECKHPGTALRFDDRGRLICATSNGPINILQISPASKTDSLDGSSYQVSLDHVFKEHLMDWSASSHHFPVVCLDLSSDGTWFAAGRFSSGKGAVHVFTLSTNEDGRYRHWWSLPKMDAPTTCIKFLGGGIVESSLAVGCSNNEFYIYNLGRRSLSHWSNDMGLPLLKSLPKELTSRSEPVARIVSNSATPQRFILGSHGYFCAVDLDQPVPERSSMFPPDHLRAKRLQLIKEDDAMMFCPPPGKKSKSNLTRDTSTNFTICLRYSEILFQDFIAENEMVVVEQPWMSILEELPDALARRVYGT